MGGPTDPTQRRRTHARRESFVVLARARPLCVLDYDEDCAAIVEIGNIQYSLDVAWFGACCCLVSVNLLGCSHT